jgi:N-formylglutamate amidohydrolase
METTIAPVVVTAGHSCTPFILSLPHSGDHYPDRLRQRSVLSALSLRRSEDAFLGTLFDFAPRLGISVVATPYARAYVDVNRDPTDIDPQLIGITRHMTGVSERALAGLGVVPRSVGAGVNIYAGPLTLDEVQHRIATVHMPYHTALAQQVARTQARHGYAVVLDMHSMPSGKVHGRSLPDIVLGDMHGTACEAVLTDSAERALETQRLRVARNAPYAGGYTTSHYGAPNTGAHVLQIEINRSLYMDEVRMQQSADFASLRLMMEQALTHIMVQVEHNANALRPAMRFAAE